MSQAQETRRQKPPFLALVVPCLNEEAILPDTIATLSACLEGLKNNGAISEESLVCYVDDGSSDSTWQIIEARHTTDPSCRGVKLAACSGQQNAIWAGLEAVYTWGCDCVITLDADLQDDITIIPEMLKQYEAGSEIVYGVRNNRDTDTFFKRQSALLFYRIMAKLDLTIIPNHSDFRLMSRVVLEALFSYGERNLFLRGLLPSLGFNSAKVYYKRLPRLAGETKYSLRKMASTAWQGITSSSVIPLRMAGFLSFICVIFSFLLGCVSIYRKYILGANIPGWTSLFIAILFMGGIQLFCLAVMGEYLAKIFTEVRHRPRYIIEKKL